MLISKLLEKIRFLIRNPSISALNVRNSYSYRKALKNHLEKNPFCAYCGRNKKLDVHHKIPVSIAPELADNENNLITLCRKPSCHLIVGHMGSWKTYNKNVEETCNIVNINHEDNKAK